MKTNVLMFFAVVLFSSCSAVGVVNPDIPKYAPLGYKGKGTIKYLNQGIGYIKTARREDAFRQMYEGCKGRYIVTSEGSRTFDDGYIYLDYICTGD